MENDDPTTLGNNTPSKLKPPKPRKSIFIERGGGIGAEDGTIGLIPMELSELQPPPPPPPPPPPSVMNDYKGGKDNENHNNNSQKRRLKSPAAARIKTISLPPAIPTSTMVGDKMVKTYKMTAATTGRPAPITKPITSNHRPPPKVAASGKSQIVNRTTNYNNPGDAIASSTGHRPAWDKIVTIIMVSFVKALGTVRRNGKNNARIQIKNGKFPKFK